MRITRTRASSATAITIRTRDVASNERVYYPLYIENDIDGIVNFYDKFIDPRNAMELHRLDTRGIEKNLDRRG